MSAPDSPAGPASWPPPTSAPGEPRRAESDPIADEVGPIDRRADPASWLSGRTLLIVVAAGVLALIITMVACGVVWFTPAMDPLQIPTEPHL